MATQSENNTHFIEINPQPPQKTQQQSRAELFLSRIARLLASELNTLFESQSSKQNPEVSQPDSRKTSAESIFSFLVNCATIAQLTEAELLYTTCLVEMLITAQLNSDSPSTDLIIRNNLGTLLLCSVIITTKMLRDSPYTNKEWARHFGVPLADLNKSERIFLSRHNFQVSVPESAIMTMLHAIEIFDCKHTTHRSHVPERV
ncbi:hypothetical protein BLNAU_9734 [Blattamonas nauphoetae]|uniref:Cyclin N-terminal domain-containing protein n=1 Tax=Blattamonas nauphoetae TaxID=2049346 RepID=A0ABQ9XV30_9EUKA|nr:hypothetical protein BLNAU_9734 [Blattamonas nauphoetae]